jgi:hypothetical protein
MNKKLLKDEKLFTLFLDTCRISQFFTNIDVFIFSSIDVFSAFLTDYWLIQLKKLNFALS